ncbi:MAG: hypothetical protein F6K10_06505 [Moorea sp. SIO2B7]|nr:hypothetical protein [Moorena sp. SIO2B7]
MASPRVYSPLPQPSSRTNGAGALSTVISNVIFTLVFGVGLGVGSIVAWNLSWESAPQLLFGEVSGAILGAISGIALGMVWVTNSGVKQGVAWGGIFGIVSGLTLAMISGVNWGLAWGIGFILGVLRVYFWLPELLWMILIFVVYRFGNSTPWLYKIPPCFDELIILPLPFMVSFIVDVYSEYPYDVRQIIAYLLNSTNQKIVAIESIIGIVIYSLSQCRTSSDIATVSPRLSWIPSLPSSEKVSILDQFWQISQAVQASQETPSLYFQSEFLKASIKRLQQLRYLIRSKKSRFFKSCRKIAYYWIRILEATPRYFL